MAKITTPKPAFHKPFKLERRVKGSDIEKSIFQRGVNHVEQQNKGLIADTGTRTATLRGGVHITMDYSVNDGTYNRIRISIAVREDPVFEAVYSDDAQTGPEDAKRKKVAAGTLQVLVCNRDDWEFELMTLQKRATA